MLPQQPDQLRRDRDPARRVPRAALRLTRLVHLAVIGPLRERGWLTAPFSNLIEEIKKGPQPYYWPYDLRTQADAGPSVIDNR